MILSKQMKPPRTSQNAHVQAELDQLFETSPAEREQNKRGALSKSQLQSIQRTNTFVLQVLTISTLVSIGLFGWILVNTLRVTPLDLVRKAPFLGALSLGVIAITLIRIAFERVTRNTDQKHVVSVEGPAALDTISSRLNLNDKHPCHTLTIADHVFRLSLDVYKVLQEDQAYRVYFLEGSTLIVSLELL